MTALAIALVIGCVVAGLAVQAYVRHREAAARDEGVQRARRTDADGRAKVAEVEERFRRGSEQLERDIVEQRQAIREREAAIDMRASELAQRDRALTAKEAIIADNERTMAERLAKADIRVAEATRELERIATMSQQEAKDALVASIEQDARVAAAVKIRALEREMRRDSDEQAARLLAQVIQREAAGFVAEKTVSVVKLPSDEMKGRIIGREGRNVRAIESATGADIIIDDTPEAVVVSAFNPVRRAIATIALERLVADGRIHPARIEEVVDAVTDEMSSSIAAAGESAMNELQLTGIHPELLKLLGRLKYHVIGGQNVLQHSIETGMLAGFLAGELGIKVADAKRAGLLHDIGKALGHEAEGHHADTGADAAGRYSEQKHIAEAIRTHHDPDPPTTLGALVYTANILSKARPGARREHLDTFIKRATDLESTALAFEGVNRAFVIQAGREVRVLVDFSKVDDARALVLSQDIARKIQDTLTYPGEVHVTVVREARATEIAR